MELNFSLFLGYDSKYLPYVEIVNLYGETSSEEELTLVDIPYIDTSRFTVSLYLLNTTLRSEPDFAFTEVEETTVHSITVIKKDKITDLIGVSMLYEDREEVILNTDYDTIEAIGTKMFTGTLEMNEDISENISKSVLIRPKDVLDFTYYYIDSKLIFDRFEFCVVRATETTDIVDFYIVREYDTIIEESDDTESIDLTNMHTLQSVDDIILFTDGLYSLVEDETGEVQNEISLLRDELLTPLRG